MSTPKAQVAQLQAAIAGQEKLRSTLGDAVVDVAIAALRQQLALVSRQPLGGGELASHALATLQSHLPAELAAKARAAGWSEGERKQVTVLFADLSGFTALSEHADPELIRAFQNDLFTELARSIYQYEGFVEKFIGDAILAVFGAPVTHEDDPERALRVALAMRERMAVLNRRWAEKLGSPVTLHVGINTGPVVAGRFEVALNGGGASYAVTGDTVNTAARLQDAARPGQVLVSRTTYRMAQGAFTFQSLDPISVRNRAEPLAAYELLRARPLPGKLRGIQELGEAFVGREPALQQLQAVTDRLDGDGGGGTVIVTGEAGIGKSRLIAEWRKRTDERVRWLEGRCFVHTATLSYGPFLDMLRRFAGIVDDDSPRRARQRLDNAVERLFPGDAEAHAVLANMLAMQLRREEKALLGRLPGQVLRERIFGLAEQLMRRLSQERPLVLFLEDMQWSDASTAELVEHLLPLSCTERFAIVAAGRPEPESPVARIAAAAENSDGPRPERLTLERLPDSASLAMVRDLLAMPELPPQLGVLISNKAEGNPFFVEEIIRSLIELGALNRSGETWTTTRLMDTISVPDTLQGLIMARIDRLPDETKDVVQHAAVIGRTFLYRILLAIAEASPSLDADLTHLERSELIRERTREPEVEYTFEHALTQEMAYQSLLSSRVRELHRRVGQAMERIFAYRLGEYYPIVAEHFRSGEDWEKTAEYEILAGNQAAAMFAPEARVHYERALDALEHLKSTPENKRRQIDLTIALAREVFFGAGAQSPEIGPVVERLDAAETPAASLVHPNGRTSDEDRLRVARLYAWIANAYSIQGDFPGVARYVDKATAASKDLQDAQLAARLGQVQLHRGRFKQAITWLAQAVDELPRHERWIEWIHANGALAYAEAGSGEPGRYEAAVKRAEGGVVRARKLGGQYLIEAANHYKAMTLLMGGQHDMAGEVLFPEPQGAMHPTGAHIREMLLDWYGERANPDYADISKRLDPHRNEHLQSYEVNRPGHTPYGGRHNAFFAGAVLTWANEPQLAEQLAEWAVQAGRKQGDVYMEALALRNLARALAANNAEYRVVAEHLQQSRELFQTNGCAVEEARTLAVWGALGMQHQDPRAQEHLTDARRIFEQAGLTWEAATVSI